MSPNDHSSEAGHSNFSANYSNAVETLCNVFYLIENNVDRPESILRLLALAGPAMNFLKAAASGSHREHAGGGRPDGEGGHHDKIDAKPETQH